MEHHDLELGTEWKWQALDGAITKAPLGGEATGPSPVDRGKSGTKRSVLTDAYGGPLSVVVTGANTNDKTVALATLDAVQAPRPEKVVCRLHRLCLDKGYDYEDVIAGVRERNYILHRSGLEGGLGTPRRLRRHPARRRVVERTHAWHHKFRRLLVRWEKKVTHYETMIHLACVLILYRLVVTSYP
jgi:putative transposase